MLASNVSETEGMTFAYQYWAGRPFLIFLRDAILRNRTVVAVAHSQIAVKALLFPVLILDSIIVSLIILGKTNRPVP